MADGADGQLSHGPESSVRPVPLPTTYDGSMTVPTDPPPDGRRLARAPSERYRAQPPGPTAAAEADASAGSPARAVAFGALVAIGGAVAISVLGGALAISAGLLVVAALIGWLIAAALRARGMGLAGLGRSNRIVAAIVLAVISVGLGQLGLWLYARTEGGVLPLGPYLAETFGVLVPLEVAVAALVAWRSAR
jgi:hypothetical protein